MTSTPMKTMLVVPVAVITLLRTSPAIVAYYKLPQASVNDMISAEEVDSDGM